MIEDFLSVQNLQLFRFMAWGKSFLVFMRYGHQSRYSWSFGWSAWLIALPALILFVMSEGDLRLLVLLLMTVGVIVEFFNSFKWVRAN